MALLRLALVAALLPSAAPQDPAEYSCKRLDAPAFRGKQDDIFFLNPELGWFVNGSGKIHKSIDGGASWKEFVNRPGTYFRRLAFVDERTGFAGNLGPDYFPGVTDTVPLYRTANGGETWAPLEGIKGPPVKGLCAIDILRHPFINAGHLDTRVDVFAAGRVGGPACFLKSADGGTSWTSTDLGASCGMILDVKFFDPDNGLLCAATDKDVQKSRELILTTSDGGATWTRHWESTRPFELTWKCSFPTRETGYVTLQSYDPDPKDSARFVVKTTDGGRTWSEIPLADDAQCREFEIGFLDENTGWVGAMRSGYETRDGGSTWKPADLGPAVNKIRLVPTRTEFVGFAIGAEVRKLTVVR